MKIQVLADDGSVKFEFDGAAAVQSASNIAAADKAAITNALHDATQFLSQDQHVIASIKADIQAAVARIETELGAHPAFTWAQTALKNAGAHLEHYVKGIWTEPPANSVPVDERGIQVPPAA